MTPSGEDEQRRYGNDGATMPAALHRQYRPKMRLGFHLPFLFNGSIRIAINATLTPYILIVLIIRAQILLYIRRRLFRHRLGIPFAAQ